MGTYGSHKLDMRTAAFGTGARESVEWLKVLPSRFAAPFLSFSYPEFAKKIPMRRYSLGPSSISIAGPVSILQSIDLIEQRPLCD